MKLGSPIVPTALVILVVSAIPLLPVSAQTPNDPGQRQRWRTLTGAIALPSDLTRYPAGIQVVLDGDYYHRMTLAGPEGTFMFAEVPLGNYVVEVRAPGFNTTRTELRGWSGYSDVNVPLGRVVEDSKDRVPPGAPTVSVQTLKVPEKAVRLAARGQEESNRGHFDKAIESLQRAVQVCPTFVEAWNNMGATYLRMDRQKEAETAFLEGLKIDPKAVPTLRNLGFLYLQTDRPKDALPVLLRARAAVGRKDLYIDTFLGHALYRVGQYEKAEAILTEAVEINSDFPAALFPLALTQVRLQKCDDARQTFTHFLQMADKGGEEVELARTILSRLEEMSEKGRKTAE